MLPIAPPPNTALFHICFPWFLPFSFRFLVAAQSTIRLRAARRFVHPCDRMCIKVTLRWPLYPILSYTPRSKGATFVVPNTNTNHASCVPLGARCSLFTAVIALTAIILTPLRIWDAA